jgi:hypothetical protein
MFGGLKTFYTFVDVIIKHLKQMTTQQIQKQINGTQFQKDLEVEMLINGNVSSRAYYNLVVSIRDVSLFSKGIKAHRFWRLKDVKAYFGVKGGTDKVLEQLKAYKDAIWVSA